MFSLSTITGAEVHRGAMLDNALLLSRCLLVELVSAMLHVELLFISCNLLSPSILPDLRKKLAVSGTMVQVYVHVVHFSVYFRMLGIERVVYFIFSLPHLI